ncbi:CDP-diacylglycerol--glycerol-3-phosphate 3-phosphatidyltransferase [Mycoplasmopsis cricetuli]|uniref:CDP-diacylglycerol--glycerol-3-phosphate 3-phosphatidyltransferase n=1 Tax=Mycoplasmopsis cricetuli TaxID=171283 RepID=UPI00068541AA|nr:CDP-diacylglycerol--glycerol-3-phosphate 3-phosphatidyltransferase [Mycoplasmopsis cricetuli]
MKLNKEFLQKNKIPNLLTIFRIIMALLSIVILTVFYILQKNNFYLSSLIDSESKSIRIYFLYIFLFIFIIAMISDFLDGYLARKWNVISNFGKLWDPLADKMITLVALIFLTTEKFYLLPIVAIILIRDLIVDGSRTLLVSKNIDIAASKLGKIKTFYISIVIICTLISSIILDSTSFNNYYVDLSYFILNNILLSVGAIISVISGYQYVKFAIPYIK